MTIELCDHSTIELTRECANDDYVLEAMLVSTLKDDEVKTYEESTKAGKINFLMKNKHGTPFEHTFFTFRAECPIFVFREWHRHRIGISINEQSARYTVMPNKFYVPPRHRPLVQVGKAGAYTFEQGTDEQYKRLVEEITFQSNTAYASYQGMLNAGIAKEIARSVLPVNIFSAMYWSCNARSLMAYLSLRTNHPEATFPSKPQWEIQQCADFIEGVFAGLMPLTYQSFVNNGRVCP